MTILLPASYEELSAQAEATLEAFVPEAVALAKAVYHQQRWVLLLSDPHGNIVLDRQTDD